LLEEGDHGKSPKCLGGNLGDFGEFCKGLGLFIQKNPDKIIKSNAFTNNDATPAAFNKK